MLDVLEKIPHVLNLSWSDAGKVFIGAFMVVFICLGWIRSIRKATKEQIRADKHRREAESERERADFHRETAELMTRHAEALLQLERQVMQAEQFRTEAENEREKVATALDVLQARLAVLESFDGKLWEQETDTTLPKYVVAPERKTRFISVVNLKGGVGKTTLTANIGVSLARRGSRVLMVDLDFQGSLTRLCKASADQLRDLIRIKRTAARLFDQNNSEQTVDDLALRISHPNLVGQTCDFIAADESSAEAELRAQARWLITKTPDARFLFRRVFHGEPVLSKYDFVLFDCPPRLTTACVNALGCSDFLLVPVLLEQGSIDALPRTMTWLKRLPHVSRARLLGVVANRVELRSGKLISDQQTKYNYLPEALERIGFHGQEVFRAIVKNDRALIEQASNKEEIAAAEDAGAALFSAVTTEIEKGVR